MQILAKSANLFFIASVVRFEIEVLGVIRLIPDSLLSAFYLSDKILYKLANKKNCAILRLLVTISEDRIFSKTFHVVIIIIGEKIVCCS